MLNRMGSSCLFALSMLLVLTSCNSGGGSGQKLSEEEWVQQAKVQDVTLSVQPEKMQIIKKNLTDAEARERYAIGCKNPGEGFNFTNEIDLTIKVGQKFRKFYSSSRLDEFGFTLDSEETITAIDFQAKEIRSDEIVYTIEGSELPFTSVNQVFDKTPHLKRLHKFTIENGGQSTGSSSTTEEMNLTDAAKKFFFGRPSKAFEYRCEVQTQSQNYDDIKSESSTDKVFYPMNGRRLIAYQSKSKRSGPVVCEKTDWETGKTISKISMGMGYEEHMHIATNDLIEIGFTSCGGGYVFGSSRVILDSGKVLQSRVNKIISSPERL